MVRNKCAESNKRQWAKAQERRMREIRKIQTKHTQKQSWRTTHRVFQGRLRLWCEDAREGEGRCVQSGHHNDHHCRETRAHSPPLYLPSAISLTHQTFIINTHTHTHTCVRWASVLTVPPFLSPTFVLLFRRFLFCSGSAKLLYFNYTRVGNTGCEARQKQTTTTTATNVGNVNENGVKNQFHGFYAAVYCCKREPHIVGGALSLTHAHTGTHTQ